MDSKEKLYYLIDLYIQGKYDTKTFCELFSDTYNLETDYNSLNSNEKVLFRGLSKMTGRFSPFEDDLKNYNCYYNEQQIKSKVEEVINKLRD
jgi:hypothetical protein